MRDEDVGPGRFDHRMSPLSWRSGILAALALHCVFHVGASALAQTTFRDSPELIILELASAEADGLKLGIRGPMGEYRVEGSTEVGESCPRHARFVRGRCSANG